MTDPHKICFIYCVNNDHYLFESLRSLKQLNIPDGFTFENRIIKNATGLTKAYNDAMKSSNAKYKIYLHQDIVVINPNFLNELITMFLKYPQLGLIGVAGPKHLPPDAYWPHASRSYGRFMLGDIPMVWNEATEDYESVQAVDGIAMMTQYDLPWREDIFKGWHFYDISQSLEFIKAGYEVGIPRQTSPWFSHRPHDSEMIGYEEDRQLFLAHYGNYIIR